MPAPAEITRPQVVAWGLRMTGMKPLTIRRKYGCLSSFFSFLQDMGRCQGNPARNLPLPKVSRNLPTVLSAEQVQQLLAAAETPQDRLLLLLLLSTGLRRSEAAVHPAGKPRVRRVICPRDNIEIGAYVLSKRSSENRSSTSSARARVPR
jgi:site-specific recombinase XerD